MTKEAKKPVAPPTIFELIQRWYDSEGGRDQSIERAKVARASARAMAASLEVPAHALDEPVTY